MSAIQKVLEEYWLNQDRIAMDRSERVQRHVAAGIQALVELENAKYQNIEFIENHLAAQAGALERIADTLETIAEGMAKGATKEELFEIMDEINAEGAEDE